MRSSRLFLTFTGVLCLSVLASSAIARSPQTDANSGMTAFANNCFSPFLTAEKAADAFSLANLRYDFYDLDPFSNVAPSPATGRAMTPGTDRRCEVSFNGDYALQASTAVVARLAAEGITTKADLPTGYTPTPGTALLAARKLNPKRIAVVHVGTRPGASEITETFLLVERLLPLNQ